MLYSLLRREADLGTRGEEEGGRQEQREAERDCTSCCCGREGQEMTGKEEGGRRLYLALLWARMHEVRKRGKVRK